MHEEIARPLYYLGVHLLYASLVWLAAWLLTSIPRGSGTIKHWIWVATSLNFVLPMGAIVDKSLASHLGWASPLGVIGAVGLRIAENARAGIGPRYGVVAGRGADVHTAGSASESGTACSAGLRRCMAAITRSPCFLLKECR